MGTIAEHALLLISAPVLLELAQNLVKDPMALNSPQMSMERTSIIYKMKHGLHQSILDSTVEVICKVPFSLNIDEATSNTEK